MTITSEELERVRKLTGQSSSIFSRHTVDGLLNLIDAQAARIAAADAEISSLAELASSNAARVKELENDEVHQRLANAEHQLYMKDLALQNVKASRRAQFRKRLAAEKELARRDAAEPVAWTDEQELRDVAKNECGYLFKANPITPFADERRVIKLYSAQPSGHVVVPVEPKESDCPAHILDPFSWKCGAGWMRDNVLRINSGSKGDE